MGKIGSFTFSNHGQLDIFSSYPTKLSPINVHQTHSNIVIHFNEGSDYNQIEADGIIFSNEHKGKSFSIKTADCLPVIYIGKESSAVVHAGWRGLQNGILTHNDLIAIKPHTIFIGPSIQQTHFEVQASFKKEFPESRNFHIDDRKLFFNLQNEALDQLKNIFKNSHISDSGICTFEDLHYNSFRRSKTNKRNWNTYTIKR